MSRGKVEVKAPVFGVDRLPASQRTCPAWPGDDDSGYRATKNLMRRFMRDLAVTPAIMAGIRDGTLPQSVLWEEGRERRR